MYIRLPFQQYFIDQSLGTRGGTPRFRVDYEETIYTHNNHNHTIYHKVLWDSERQVIQCYFKETSDKSEWRANFEFGKKYYDRFSYQGELIQLKTAGGWGDMYVCIKHKIREDVRELKEQHPEAEVEIIGWSLGSALAQLCCQDLYYNFQIKSHVFTYGSVKPWCSSKKLVKQYLAESYIECYNFGDHNDIVTYMVCLPGYFKLNKVKIMQDKFCIFRLFNPNKYHCEYWKEEYYKDVK